MRKKGERRFESEEKVTWERERETSSTDLHRKKRERERALLH